jgi:hypothetical protein
MPCSGWSAVQCVCARVQIKNVASASSVCSRVVGVEGVFVCQEQWEGVCGEVGACWGAWVFAVAFYLSTEYSLHTGGQEWRAVGIQGPCFTEAAQVEGL